MSDSDLIAAYLAKRAATQCDTAPAYGVDPAADKERRRVARLQRDYAASEREGERYAESVREAYHTGGRAAAIEAMNGRN